MHECTYILTYIHTYICTVPLFPQELEKDNDSEAANRDAAQFPMLSAPPSPKKKARNERKKREKEKKKKRDGRTHGQSGIVMIV
jgi:hypothetical protein